MIYQFYILKKQAFKERQSLYTLLTDQDVILKVIGQDQTKMKYQSMQSFQRLEADINIKTHSSLHTMKKPDQLHTFHFLGAHVFAGMYVNELIVKSSDEGPQSPGLFDLYHQTLSDLDTKQHLALSMRKFEIKWLELQGFGIDLSMPDRTPLSVQHSEWQYHTDSPYHIMDIKNVLNGTATPLVCKNIRKPLHQMIAVLMPSQSLNTLKWLQTPY